MSVAPRTLSHLDELEAEAIHIFREVASELERPVPLFSGGKDSIVLLRLDDLAEVTLRLSEPLAVDPYPANRATGAFVLVDEATDEIVSAS